MTDTAWTEPTCADLAERVEEVNRANGWFDDDRTFGDDLALLHSEVSEALEAYRDHGTEDATADDLTRYDSTAALPKPEGLGSELADVLVRLFDTYTRRDHLRRPDWWNRPLADMPLAYARGESIGDHLAYVHKLIALLCLDDVGPQVCALARLYELDIVAEFDRKVAYNATRGHRHGGKRL